MGYDGMGWLGWTELCDFDGERQGMRNKADWNMMGLGGVGWDRLGSG